MYMDFLFIPAFLIPFLPAILSALGGGITAMASSGAVNRMNRYNDPRAQLQRLNAAGLPFAAFAAGQAGQQSTLPDLTGLGQGFEAFGNYFVNKNQIVQHDILKEQLRGAASSADILGNQKLISDAETDAMMKYGATDVFGKQVPLATKMKHFEYLIKEQELFMKENENKLKTIDTIVKQGLYDAGRLSEEANALIDATILKNNVLKNMLKTQEMQTAGKQLIFDRMKQNGLSFAEALFMVAIQAISGSLKIGGAGIGF